MPRELTPRCVPKLTGADFELSNFIVGLECSGGTGAQAARALLREIDGVASSSGARVAYASGAAGTSGRWSTSGTWGGWSSGVPFDAQDQGRKFLRSNGGCVYIDLDHLELCIPEVLSAFDHAAACAAMLRVAQGAQRRANARLPAGQRLEVLANNSDGRSNSYGSHLNFLISRAAWNDILEQRPHYLHLLATHQLSSMIYTGQGKVGAENGRPDVAYQISQRADFIETTTGPQTTYRRPIVNSRNESLCGRNEALARLHVIFFDNTLCPGASVLKVGAMQLVLAMLEAEDVDPRLALDDPVAAACTWSHDPTLRVGVRLVDGAEATALEIQQRILHAALRHRQVHGFETVPRCDEILELWEDTLEKLAAGDFDALAGRLDWVLKHQILERALEGRPELDWSSPQLKFLDQLYASIDPEQGLFWPYAERGLVEPWVSEEAIARFVDEPPDDTRAWTRAMLLRSFDDHEITRVDWDRISLDTDERGATRHLEIRLDDPLRFTREEAGLTREEAGLTRKATAALFEGAVSKRRNS